AFWTGPFGRLPAFRGSANVEALAHLTTLNYGNKIRIIEGDHEVWPGLRVHRVGGHTAGLQIVSVETRRGTVLLTSHAPPLSHKPASRRNLYNLTRPPPERPPVSHLSFLRPARPGSSGGATILRSPMVSSRSSRGSSRSPDG